MIVNEISDHIKSFPNVESHYCRKYSKKFYLLEEGLSVTKMYRLFLEAKGYTSVNVSRQMYSKIFNTKNNLAFFKPKKDQ